MENNCAAACSIIHLKSCIFRNGRNLQRSCRVESKSTSSLFFVLCCCRPAIRGFHSHVNFVGPEISLLVGHRVALTCPLALHHCQPSVCSKPEISPNLIILPYAVLNLFTDSTLGALLQTVNAGALPTCGTLV